MQRVISSEVMAEYRTPGMFNTNGIWQIGPMIITWGTDEQKARWLPIILEAHDHWCQGFSEPQAGNDLANLRTTAVLDGDHYVVNGQKIWISTAHLSKWGLFLLRTDPTAIERGAKHEGITAFILDMETPGIECRPIRDIAGEEMFNEVFFTDARIPVDCRLGDEGQGWMVAMGTLGFERVGIAGQLSILGCGPAGYGRGGPVRQPEALADPSLQERLVKAWTEIELAKLLSLRAFSRIIKGEKPWPEVQFAKITWSSLAQGPGRPVGRPSGPGRGAACGRPRRRRPGQVDPSATPSSVTARSGAVRPRSRRTSSPTGPSSSPVSPASPDAGVSSPPPTSGPMHHRRRPTDLASRRRRARRRPRAAGDVGRGGPGGGRRRVLLGPSAASGRSVVYRQAWQYDDPAGRLAEALGGAPPGRVYSGIGGSVPQVLVAEAAEAVAAGRLDLGSGGRGRGPGHRPAPEKGRDQAAWSHEPAERRPFPFDVPFTRRRWPTRSSRPS